MQPRSIDHQQSEHGRNPCSTDFRYAIARQLCAAGHHHRRHGRQSREPDLTRPVELDVVTDTDNEEHRERNGNRRLQKASLAPRIRDFVVAARILRSTQQRYCRSEEARRRKQHDGRKYQLVQ